MCHIGSLMDQEIAKGKFLIALPILRDPNFRQTIVLLCEHGPDGSLGLVVNRPTGVEVSTLINDLPDLAGALSVFFFPESCSLSAGASCLPSF